MKNLLSIYAPANRTKLLSVAAFLVAAIASLVCAFLQEAFSNLPGNEAFARLIFSSVGFIGTGLLVLELVRNRRGVLNKNLVLLRRSRNLRPGRRQRR